MTKSTARTAARTTAYGLLADDVPADDIADAMISQALAIWAAAYARPETAASLLRVWCEVRDAH